MYQNQELHITKKKKNISEKNSLQCHYSMQFVVRNVLLSLYENPSCKLKFS